MILPNGFVPAEYEIYLWCNIKHAAPQPKLALTSPETTWDSTQRLISNSFLIAVSGYSKRTIEWWHRRNQAPKIKVGRSRRLPLTPCSLLFLVGFTTKERPKCTESVTHLMIVPNYFVPVAWGISPWCNIKHAALQLKLALTSQETTWDSPQYLISSSFPISGNYLSQANV